MGRAQLMPVPSDRQVGLLSTQANHQVIPINHEAAPPGTPLRPGGPIKHVLHIVRENRPTTRCWATTRAATATPS